MTPPTREQVVQWMKQAGFDEKQWSAMTYDSGPYEVTTPKHAAELLINLARADLEAKVTELEAENFIFQSQVKNHSEVIAQLRQQLSEAQARESQMREAGNAAANYIDILGGDSGRCRQVVTLPSDDSALREWGAKLVEKITQFSADVIELYDDATIQADYMIDSTDCHAILIALAPYIADKIREGKF